VSTNRAPVARLWFEVKQINGIKRVIKKLKQGDNLYDLSGNLEQYRGLIITDINAVTDFIEFTNGDRLHAGEVTGDVNESALRRIQIREAIKAHFDKEKTLFNQGIKVLTLFFIDKVAKYRLYEDGISVGGEYAEVFEEEYVEVVNELKQDLFLGKDYCNYLDRISASDTHKGYFSIDKKGKMVNAIKNTKSEMSESTDQSAYDLIFREGWDNTNVFVICTLKHSDNTISRRQEVGRGLRICVNKSGDRQDDPATVHLTNVLTVVASESYRDFVNALQQDISDSLSSRPRIADEDYFIGKVMKTQNGNVTVTPKIAKQIYRYLVKNDYSDDNNRITTKYHDDLKNNSLASLPDELSVYEDHIFQLIDSVYSDANLPQIEDDRGAKTNLLNANYQKKEFKELWNRINKKMVYSVHFDSKELIEKSVKALNNELHVTPLQYSIQIGEQNDQISYDQIKSGSGFEVHETRTEQSNKSIQSKVKYDLIGKIAGNTQLTRKTISDILSQLQKPVFGQFRTNPECFISESSRLVNEQKATAIIEHLKYDPIDEKYDVDIFTNEQAKQDFSKADKKLNKHIYDYVITDSKVERAFVNELDTSAEIVLYAKLPRGFAIPTPVGNYNPDWAISFKEGSVKHIYFVAETKGTMSSMELREIEKTKINCAKKFFSEINRSVNLKHVTYDVVDSYGKLMEIVGI
jgi:type III restriction enzyme